MRSLQVGAYDGIGHIVGVADDAQQTVFFAGQVVEPSSEYEYDALYRLTKANGREHRGHGGDAQRDHGDGPLNRLPHPNDVQALRRYEERFAYDDVGNILELVHDTHGAPGSWRRRYRYGVGEGDGSSNRLHSTSLPGDSPEGYFSARYPHDANGNMVAMPHLGAIEYTHADQVRRADLGGGGTAFYTYDASGERVRKVIERDGALTEERVYLGGYEIYRKRDTNSVLLERQTLHVMDDTRRIAMVETKIIDSKDPADVDVSRVRFHYANHLESALLECDAEGLAITYEEYHPYGTTAYRSARSGLEVSEKGIDIQARSATRRRASPITGRGTTRHGWGDGPHRIRRGWSTDRTCISTCAETRSAREILRACGRNRSLQRRPPP